MQPHKFEVSKHLEKYTVSSIDGVHVDAMLTNFAVGFSLPGFLADRIMPIKFVDWQSNIYPVFGLEELDVIDDLRADNAAYKRVAEGWSKDTYFCEEYGLERPVSNRIQANADEAYGNPTQRAAAVLLRRIMMLRERRVAAKIFNLTNWTTTHTLSDTQCWSNPNSEPHKQLADDAAAIEALGGNTPNTLVLGISVWTALKNHPKFQKMFEVGIVPTLQRISEYLEIPNILVPKALNNTAGQGADRVLSRIWGNYVWLGYVPENQVVGMEEPTAACQFCWGEGTANLPYISESYEEKQTNGVVVRVRTFRDYKVTGPGYGAIRGNVVDANAA